MSQAYSDPARASDPYALPDVEAFYFDGSEQPEEGELEAGWYWWPCFPGCMPDGDPNGPYLTENEAIAAAQEEQEEGNS